MSNVTNPKKKLPGNVKRADSFVKQQWKNVWWVLMKKRQDTKIKYHWKLLNYRQNHYLQIPWNPWMTVFLVGCVQTLPKLQWYWYQKYSSWTPQIHPSLSLETNLHPSSFYLDNEKTAEPSISWFYGRVERIYRHQLGRWWSSNEPM